MDEADRLIAAMEAEVRGRIKEGLYGADHETLEEVLLQTLRGRELDLAVVECGLNGALRGRLERVRIPAESALVLDDPCEMADLRRQVAGFMEQRGAHAGLGISLQPATHQQTLSLVIITPRGAEEYSRSYGGERALSNPWAVNTGLEYLRRNLTEG
jgi:hypothetical protein